MAAATGTPDAHEPLLGQRDDLDCPPEPRQKIFVNLITGKPRSPCFLTANSFPNPNRIGTASIAQVGVWVVSDPQEFWCFPSQVPSAC